ncbi:MAG: hypothetical protein ACYCU0_02375 [Solirubrobacteraceae bacterium]
MKEVALRVSASLGPYRVGGEEFLVLLPHAETGEAVRIAERLLRAVRSSPVTA